MVHQWWPPPRCQLQVLDLGVLFASLVDMLVLVVVVIFRNSVIQCPTNFFMLMFMLSVSDGGALSCFLMTGR